MIFLEIEPVWTWSHFAFGLTYAIVASLIFLFLVLWLFKPKIRIAPYVCRIGDRGEAVYYSFKIVNVSFFPAHDVKIELHKTRRITMGAGKYNNERERITLVNGEISHLPARQPFWRRKDSDPHCLTVRSIEDISEILEDPNKGISLQVSLRHGLTGLPKVFDQEYGQGTPIKNGRFAPGTKFEKL
ncbi:MAG TPA: hypothetical protein VGS79_15650 [Puia sp.]|nr:hypothetical protein [Puia sp.]